MIRTLASLVVTLLLAACQSGASAQAQPEKPLANIQVVTSPGGITAWLITETHLPAIAMEIAWKGGMAHEPRGKEGLGWVLAYMMNEGAGDLDTRAYGARMEDLGMRFACGVWVDWTQCSLTTLKATADESFALMQLAFDKLRLDDEPFDRARREFAVAIQRDQTNPRTIASRAMNEAIIPGHAYTRTPTAESLKRITRQDVRRFKQLLMTKDRLLVVVVGDITAEELKPRLDQVFGNLPATSILPAVSDATPRKARRDPVIKPLSQPQTLVMFSGPGIRRDDPDFFAAYVLNYILGGGGLSSRLSEDIRDKRGLTYAVASGLSIQQHLWRWTGSVSTQNETANEVVELVRENIARLGREGPTEAELADAKAYLTGAFPLAFESNAKTARNLLGFWQDNQPADYVLHRNGYINAVTLDDVKRVARKYMRAQDFTFVMVGEPTTD